MLITSAISYYHANNATIAAQQGVLLGLNRISAELTESNLKGVLIIDQAGAQPHKGIAFPSGRDEANSYQFDSFGKIKWQKFICYYLKDVNDKGEFAGEKSALVRKSLTLKELNASAPEAGITPPPDSSSEAASGIIPTLLPSGAALNLLLSTTPDSVAGRYVSGFTAAMEQAGDRKILRIKLAAETSYRNKFRVEAETAVMIRN